ncbi:MAG: hypothetical protein H6719_37205 [Sandaracinaceae bacterium]|nr:hypothetical protein [Sandaracinaceae bacterium]
MRWVIFTGGVLLALASRAEAQSALEVEGYAPAAFVAADGDGPRPVVVALHGNFDRPEWMCGFFARIVEGRAFLLCPRGVPRTDAPGQDRWQLPLAVPLAREIAAGRRALAARFPGRLDDGPDLVIGFSQGAHRASRLAAADPERYPRLQLVEGGASFWRGAARYGSSRGRVAFVCAVGWCEQRGRRAVEAFERGHVEARLERRPGAHHALDVMEPALRETFQWLVADDPRFASR